MDEDEIPLDQISLPVLLRFARGTYTQAMREAFAALGCEDMPRNGTYVIGAIARGRIPMSQIIQDLDISKQAVGQLVDVLVLRGYLERTPDPDDRRRLNLSLTERGLAVAHAASVAIKGIEAALTERVGAELVAHTRETLAALAGLRGAVTPVEAAPAAPPSTRFVKRRMDGAAFRDVSMACAVFDDVNLADSAFSNVNLKGARITNANLSGVAITNAKIDGLTIFGHDIPSLIRAEIKRKSAGA
jgi:DNA-binding MarR family transcriptional regulator